MLSDKIDKRDKIEKIEKLLHGFEILVELLGFCQALLKLHGQAGAETNRKSIDSIDSFLVYFECH